MEDLGHWEYSGSIDAGAVGFVYLITELSTGRYYIGKKVLTFKVTKKPLKGKTRKRKGSKESDWRTYTGSSDELNALIEKRGKAAFSFVILRVCRSRAELNYHEAKEQFLRGCLESGQSFNRWISVKTWGPGMKKPRG